MVTPVSHAEASKAESSRTDCRAETRTCSGTVPPLAPFRSETAEQGPQNPVSARPRHNVEMAIQIPKLLTGVWRSVCPKKPEATGQHAAAGGA